MKILIIGGSLYFGKKLTQLLIEKGHQVTLLNRGNQENEFGNSIERIKCDRNDTEKMKEVLSDKNWDVVFDQVCYDSTTAKAACDIFKDKVRHYIFTSSQSVYEAGSNISEEVFKPENHHFEKEETADSNYAEAKRQAEAAFEKYATFPISYVRFPIVLGSNDYTNRLKFHVDRIKNHKEIYFKNLEASISFISSKDAACSLIHIAENNILGPINCCNDESIKIKDLVKLIENATHSKLIQAKERTTDNFSPYGIDKDWYMNSSKLKSSGLQLNKVVDMVQKVLKSYI